MGRIYDDITKTIGNTPLVKLNRIADGAKATILAKLESFNPVGCVKERIGISMIEDAESKGLIDKDTVVIEPVVTDLNGDDVNITISEPVGDSGIWKTGYTDHGIYNITIIADDGTVKTTKSITLTVNDVNVAPVIEDVTQEEE